ncbi:S8 family serine peptidase [Flavobacterium lacisediminis]|uniref:S8 family serine peptidase n=1 Tax=Flavobacterium lacisediminis TaxID=2989705 RepID=A0ABT3EE69_9FLAO|nr:S8 family serine peptidase [Flavobacterium lacisediminis]MCW1146857.1 S8 family serine peptidase [Flavobacterium lacisediminis]
MKKQQLFTSFFVFCCAFSFSQTKDDVAKITKDYDVEKIQQKITYFQKLEETERAKAIEAANRNGWPIIIKGENGAIQQLMKLTPDGFPVYYATTNVAAARSTRASFLNTGGGMGLTLDGQGMVARVWDGGTTRRTHNGFGGRVTTIDDVAGTTYSDHATHVTGTIIALPWNAGSAGVKGMATLATARTFNWDSDEAEALSEVLGGMLISNHSYGVPITSGTTSLPAWYIGAYTDDARGWDEIAYLSPYYLPVMSAGNDGTNNNNSNPIAGGYDKLTGNKTSKNTLIVANAQDAVINADGSLSSVAINTSSSQGPTDDRRIKPDITGNGTSLTSTVSTSNTATGIMSGTSMSGPNVAGTLLLVQQHHKNLTNSFMKSATLRGLACHTADDAGNAGPDARFGWGLLNAKKAVETLTGNGLTSWVSENNLTQGQTFTMTVKSTGGASNPLIASITWTDLPGVANNGTLGDNNTTPALVNDLDIRVTKDGTTTFYPWKLQSSPTALAIRTGDNNVDNIEVIKIDTPAAGDYVITVTHKGTLVTGAQNYSLVVTGIVSDFALTSKSDDLIVCSNQDAVYTFDYKQSGTMTTTFSAVGLPSGATATFSPTSLSANGTVTMTVSSLSSVQPGNYTVGITGSNGTEVETRLKQMRVYSATFQPTVLTTPTSGQNSVATTVFFNWNSNVNVESYNLQVSTQSNFSSFITNVNTAENNYLVSGLTPETTYYWRVVPSNRCGTAAAASATVNNFRTGIVSCGNTFTATDFSNASIATTVNSIATVPIVVTGGLTIGDINVSIDITHTYIQDMKYYLEGPAAIGSPIITLFEEPCGDNDDINCTLDDAGVNFTCGTGIPSITGTVKPIDYLTTLNNLPADGTWILRVVDSYNGDGGSINAVSLSICNIAQSLSTPSNALAEIKVYPNPTKGILNINLASDTFGESTYILYDVQGRQVVTKKSSNAMETLNVENLSEGIYMLTIENDLGKTTRKVVINK